VLLQMEKHQEASTVIFDSNGWSSHLPLKWARPTRIRGSAFRFVTGDGGYRNCLVNVGARDRWIRQSHILVLTSCGWPPERFHSPSCDRICALNPEIGINGAVPHGKRSKNSIPTIIDLVKLRLGPSHPRLFAALAIIGLACCIALSLGGGGYVVYLAGLQHARNSHVELAISHLTNGIPDRDKAIFKTELGWYLDGEYDRINASDLDTLDIYLQRIDPSLVRHKLRPK
jgi:hypothetical protein